MRKLCIAESRPSVPELRVEPLTGQEVLFAPDRMARPNAFRSSPAHTDDPADCPFCPGNEDATPAASAMFQLPRSSGNWDVRIVPNLFPAIAPLSTSSLDGSADTFDSARGHHEVVIETRQHFAGIPALSIEEIALVWHAIQTRFRDWRSDPRIRMGAAFKNCGVEAGASLAHPHSQLLGLSFVTRGMTEELRRAREHHLAQGRCLLCDLVADEEAAETRIIELCSDFVAYAPFAAGLPFEHWIVPRAHASHFEESPSASWGTFAEVLRSCIRRLEAVIPGVAFNLVLQSSPFDIPVNEHYHWHLRVLPRCVRKAGFEWYSGCQINPVLPEYAARTMRQA